MTEDSIFTKIIKREIPAHIIYEDDNTIAFLDINPIQTGHTLVVSKNPVESFETLPDTDYEALMATVKKVAKKIKQVYKPKRIGVLIEGFEIDHVHVKVLPINSENELRRLPSADEMPDSGELEKVAKKLKIS